MKWGKPETSVVNHDDVLAVFTQRDPDMPEGKGGTIFVLIENKILVAIGHDDENKLHMYHLTLKEEMPYSAGGFMGE